MSDNHELSVTRFIAAKPDKVWDIMVNRAEEWWCPKPWRAEIDQQDRRPMGVCNMTFYGPDGETWELYAWLDGGAPGKVAA